MGVFSTVKYCNWLLPGLDFPIDQEQQAGQEHWAGNYQVNQPNQAHAETDNVTGSQADEEHPAGPFPAPGNRQGEQDRESGEEMHENDSRMTRPLGAQKRTGWVCFFTAGSLLMQQPETSIQALRA